VSVAVVIQARMGSTRLPGKSLMTLGDRPVLAWTVQRARRAPGVDEVLVATSDGPEDDPIEEQCAALDAGCVRGSSADVLDRYRLALDSTPADVIVRLTADCPFVDPGIVAAAVTALDGADYASTVIDGRYAKGLDAEAMRRDVLLAAAAEATAADEREHVTLFIYRRRDRFDCRPAVAPEWARRPDLRFTVDEDADLQLVRAVVDGLAATPETLTGPDVVGYLDAHPEVATLNRSVQHRHVR
jgi:spore coat polysaccharide biosynthesis protein SpsF